jgi:hypothetical protein
MRAEAIPGTGEDRHCALASCGAALVRRPQEGPSRWRRRRFCSPPCARRGLVSPVNAARKQAALEARVVRDLEREEARQQADELAQAYRLPRAEQAALLQRYLEETGLHEHLSLRLLAALCWRHRGLEAAWEFVQGCAATVRRSELEVTNG